MKWPQITLIVLFALSWMMTLASHGEPKTGLAAKNDIGLTTAAVALYSWLLWCGGFFD